MSAIRTSGRQSRSCPETGLEEINDDLPEADLRTVSWQCNGLWKPPMTVLLLVACGDDYRGDCEGELRPEPTQSRYSLAMAR